MDSISSEARKAEAFIHFSPLGPVFGGESGIKRNKSAKWSLMNLNNLVSGASLIEQ